MDKAKRRYNWRARQVVHTEIDNASTAKICIDPKTFKQEQFDSCNALVLPAEKRKTKKKKEGKTAVTRILNKKQRKRLEKIVDRKKKKENRVELLAALASVQPAPELSAQLTSIATVQTRGLKRQRTHTQLEEAASRAAEVGGKMPRVSSIAGSRRLRKKLLPPPPAQPSDPNVLGFEESEDSSSDEDLSEEEEPLTEPLEEPLIAPEPPEQQPPTEEAPEKPTAPPPEKTAAPPPDKAAPAVFVSVHRPRGMQAARMKLPVLAEEQAIMEAVRENPVVVIAGETGSGKTTQLPQFLYEAGYATGGKVIGVTEPRRVAAVSMSRRVAQEMGLTERQVSYLIRFEGSAGPDTRILFMTDGVLLREARHDLLLSRYSAIVVDEAHERSVFTDILVGLLSRVVILRAKRGDPLKLIIMSATLRLADFTENPRLFKCPPPVVSVDSRQFPVTVHFAKRTAADYVAEAYRKTCKVHTQLPDGGILVFVTGQQEVRALVRRLRRAFPFSGDTHVEEEKGRRGKRHFAPRLPALDLDCYPLQAAECDDEPLDSGLSSDDEDTPVCGSSAPLWVLPLYSLLPSREQARVFEAPPPGTRLCVVATNVAETSLTIPGVKYVVDTGRCKTRRYDKLTGVSAFNVDWTSKASADQRAGRAGRVGPGHCYRLYSSAMFNDQMPQFAEPDIRRRPVDDLLLQMKSMGIHKVVNFPFPSAPDLLQLRAAERRLTVLGALEKSPVSGLEEQFTGKLTALGKSISAFPVAPRYGKMLALSAQHAGLLPHAVTLVAALSVPELLLDPVRAGKACGLTGQSRLLGDPAVLLRAMSAAERAAQQGGEEGLRKVCESRGLRTKGVTEVRKLRAQLTSEINLGHPELGLSLDPKLAPLSETQARLLRQVVLSGMVDQVALRVDPLEIADPLERPKWRHAYRCAELEDPVFMMSSSVLRKNKPQWVVYQEVFETSKLCMRGVTAIEPEWLPVYAPALCNLSAPLPDPPPRLDEQRLLCSVTGTFGRGGWELPRVEIDFPRGPERYRMVAQLLLEGALFPRLAKLRPALLSSPGTVTKSWANLVPRTTSLLAALCEEEADSKQRLEEVWREKPLYLLSCYQQWLPESAHNDAARMWPPL